MKNASPPNIAGKSAARRASGPMMTKVGMTAIGNRGGGEGEKGRGDDDGEVGGQALQELLGVLGFLAFAVAHQVHGHFVKSRVAFEFLANAQDQSRLVRVDLFDLGHEDELTAG